jgi:hypothetical protein
LNHQIFMVIKAWYHYTDRFSDLRYFLDTYYYTQGVGAGPAYGRGATPVGGGGGIHPRRARDG